MNDATPRRSNNNNQISDSRETRQPNLSHSSQKKNDLYIIILHRRIPSQNTDGPLQVGVSPEIAWKWVQYKVPH